MQEELKKLITEAKNICVIPSQTEPESLSASLALFYTLKDLGKNVNLVTDQLPEKLNFLLPSLDSLSTPKNFVISIPRTTADISQIYYEKNEDSLKIHLTINKGSLKKENISFYYSEAKPDLIITLGVHNFQKELEGRLDSFGFLLNAPIINIDNHPDNLQFGTVNTVKDISLSEILLQMLSVIDAPTITANIANAMLAGLVLHYQNFKSTRTTPEIFKLVSDLIKNGANYQQVNENLSKSSPQELRFLQEVMQAINTSQPLSVVTLSSPEFEAFGETEASFVVEKIQTIGLEQDTMVLWKSHTIAPAIKGFFYSKKPTNINKFAEQKNAHIKNGWVFLQIPGDNIESIKSELIKLL